MKDIIVIFGTIILGLFIFTAMNDDAAGAKSMHNMGKSVFETSYDSITKEIK